MSSIALANGVGVVSGSLYAMLQSAMMGSFLLSPIGMSALFIGIQRASAKKNGIIRCPIYTTAGGKASNGTTRILDLVPKAIHDRSCIFLGTSSEVDAIEEWFAKTAKK
ncbi:Fructose-1,6-bisphosphatase [Batrachochytrium dendrobatidis]|nr:Fructose-1,6-bisphosphatase [Batrachochytrium dendrobatidis]